MLTSASQLMGEGRPHVCACSSPGKESSLKPETGLSGVIKSRRELPEVKGGRHDGHYRGRSPFSIKPGLRF